MPEDSECDLATGWIELEGVHNARDVGGLPTASGGRTRRGVLLRSDALDALTVGDVAHLIATFGLKHVVDLRSASEREERGRGRLGHEPVTYSELEIINAEAIARRRTDRVEAMAAGTDPVAIMADGYAELLELGGAAYAGAFVRIVAPGGIPALVHCSAGKDRTGVFVALLLDAAGVERNAIVADYAATAGRMQAVVERLSHAGAFRALAEQLPSFVFEAHAETMTLFLQHLDQTWGGGAAFLRAHGADELAIQRWTALIIESDGP